MSRSRPQRSLVPRTKQKGTSPKLKPSLGRPQFHTGGADQSGPPLGTLPDFETWSTSTPRPPDLSSPSRGDPLFSSTLDTGSGQTTATRPRTETQPSNRLSGTPSPARQKEAEAFTSRLARAQRSIQANVMDQFRSLQDDLTGSTARGINLPSRGNDIQGFIPLFSTSPHRGTGRCARKSPLLTTQTRWAPAHGDQHQSLWLPTTPLLTG